MDHGGITIKVEEIQSEGIQEVGMESLEDPQLCGNLPVVAINSVDYRFATGYIFVSYEWSPTFKERSEWGEGKL